MTDTKPAIGARIMRPYGVKEYVNFGEIGTVTAHTERGYIFLLDDVQPMHLAMFGSKSRLDGHVREMELSSDTIIPLAQAYRESAERLRRVAEMWEKAAEGVEDAPTSSRAGES